MRPIVQLKKEKTRPKNERKLNNSKKEKKPANSFSSEKPEPFQGKDRSAEEVFSTRGSQQEKKNRGQKPSENVRLGSSGARLTGGFNERSRQLGKEVSLGVNLKRLFRGEATFRRGAAETSTYGRCGGRARRMKTFAREKNRVPPKG